MLISMPTGTSTIFGAFQAIHLSQVYGANTLRAGSYVPRSGSASVRCGPAIGGCPPSKLFLLAELAQELWAAFHRSRTDAPRLAPSPSTYNDAN
jgi:hypothetical protein